MLSAVQKVRPMVSKVGTVANSVTISGPPARKMSTLGKVSYCAFMAICSVMYPTYIMANLKYYKGEVGQDQE